MLEVEKLEVESSILRIIICLRKSKITMERISVCNVISGAWHTLFAMLLHQ